MARDVLDPGDGTFPNIPRNPDGSIDTDRLPLGLRRQNGKLIDVTPGNLRDENGNLLPIPGLAEAVAKGGGAA